MLNLNTLCGAKPSFPDKRDYHFSDLCAGVSVIPEYSNNSDEIIRNQLSSSMCGAFAGAAYRYSQEWYQSNNQDLFSTTMIYGADDSYSGEGMYGRDLAKILKTGVCKLQSDWEIIGTKSQCRKVYSEKKNLIKKEFNSYRTSSYYFCKTWVEILLAISSTNGCIVMLPIYENWNNCSGILGKNHGKFYGYHFVFAMDYIKKDNGAYRIRFKNSWGESWGDKGFGYLDTDVNGFEEAFAIVDNVEEVKAMLFKDVDKNSWYSESIEKVVKAGFMKGDSEDIFRPEDPITRAEVAAIICRLQNL